ncbi:MAG: elongation factor Ts [Candidatus Taylorbacteria bacterium]|nr:elongation factor Ts [Candidatus Taylorbacteria bacterium]
MAKVTAEMIKELRARTGVSVMQCRKALEDAGGDPGKAVLVLRELSSEAAAKRSGRALGSSAIAAYIHATGGVGAMVELSSETDFVSRHPEFKTLAYEIAMHVAASNSPGIEVLLKEEYIKNPSQTVGRLIDSAIQKFGEKISVVQFARFQSLSPGRLEK